jgi:hypothetical protein
MLERPTGETEARPPKKRSYLPQGYNPLLWPGQKPPFKPNWFSWQERIASSFLAVALLAYGTLGVYIDDLWIPGKRGPGLHLHGTPAWLMYGAIVSAASICFALVIDHYDRRNNESHYELFKKWAKYCGWALFGLSLGWHVLQAWRR